MAQRLEDGVRLHCLDQFRQGGVLRLKPAQRRFPVKTGDHQDVVPAQMLTGPPHHQALHDIL